MGWSFLYVYGCGLNKNPRTAKQNKTKNVSADLLRKVLNAKQKMRNPAEHIHRGEELRSQQKLCGGQRCIPN